MCLEDGSRVIPLQLKMTYIVSASPPPEMKKLCKNKHITQYGWYGKFSYASIYATKDGIQLLNLVTGKWKWMTLIAYGLSVTHNGMTLCRSYPEKWFSHMDYVYDFLCGNNSNVYAFDVSHKVYKLLSDDFPFNVKDLDHIWPILDNHPIELPRAIRVFYINFHQDDATTPNIQLIPAQLNVGADELATWGLKILKPKKNVLFDPVSKKQLSVNVCTITRKIKHTLQETIHIPALQQYYKTWLNWFSTIFDAL